MKAQWTAWYKWSSGIALGALAFGLSTCVVECAWSASAEDEVDSPRALRQAMREAEDRLRDGQEFDAAAIFFNVYTAEGAIAQGVGNEALARLTEALVRGNFPNAAAYFFIKTLQSNDRTAIRRVLVYLPELLEEVSGDLLKTYILRHTREEDYSPQVRAHFYYFLSRDELLKGDPAKVMQVLGKIDSSQGLGVQLNYLRGTAAAMLGDTGAALRFFDACRNSAARRSPRSRAMRREVEDLEARCTAGLARTHYQRGEFTKAEEWYDEIPKSTFVWTDVLFEQAWNAFAQKDYNRALGKLVSYRSPSLSFVFNPEIEVLQAQSFLALCRYDDVNRIINDFNQRYAGVGLQMKSFLQSKENDYGAFYNLAKRAYHQKLHGSDLLSRAMNRFIRGPYFAAQLHQETATQRELQRLHGETSRFGHRAFAEFLRQVLTWRLKSTQLLGGVFVRNFLQDIYDDFIANFDKISFIKLEMLSGSKKRLDATSASSKRFVEENELARSSRRDHQYYFSFNGEFWLDELGDYVFDLDSQCGS